MVYLRQYLDTKYVCYDLHEFCHIFFGNDPYTLTISQLETIDCLQARLVKALHELFLKCNKSNHYHWLLIRGRFYLQYSSLTELCFLINQIRLTFNIPTNHILCFIKDINLYNVSMIRIFLSKVVEPSFVITTPPNLTYNEVYNAYKQYVQGKSNHFWHVYRVLKLYVTYVRFKRIRITCYIHRKSFNCFVKIAQIVNDITYSHTLVTYNFYSINTPLSLVMTFSRYLKDHKLDRWCPWFDSRIEKGLLLDHPGPNNNVRLKEVMNPTFMNEFFKGGGNTNTPVQQFTPPSVLKTYKTIIEDNLGMSFENVFPTSRIILNTYLLVVHVTGYTYTSPIKPTIAIIDKPLAKTVIMHKTVTCCLYKLDLGDDTLPIKNSYNFNISGGNDLKVRQVLLQFYNSFLSKYPDQKMIVKVSNVRKSDRVVQSGIVNEFTYRHRVLKNANYIKVNSFPGVKRYDEGKGNNNVTIHRQSILTSINIKNDYRVCKEAASEIYKHAETLEDVQDIIYNITLNNKELINHVVIGLVKLMYLKCYNNRAHIRGIIDTFKQTDKPRLLINRFIRAQNHAFGTNESFLFCYRPPITRTSIKSLKNRMDYKPPYVSYKSFFDEFKTLFDDFYPKYFKRKIWQKHGLFSYILSLVFANDRVFYSPLVDNLLNNILNVLDYNGYKHPQTRKAINVIKKYKKKQRSKIAQNDTIS